MSDVLSTTVTLQRPVSHNGATYASLTMREATVGDQLAVYRPGISTPELEVALIAQLAGVPVEMVRLVRLADYQQLQQVLANFPYSLASESPGPSAGSPSPSAANP